MLMVIGLILLNGEGKYFLVSSFEISLIVCLCGLWGEVMYVEIILLKEVNLGICRIVARLWLKFCPCCVRSQICD